MKAIWLYSAVLLAVAILATMAYYMWRNVHRTPGELTAIQKGPSQVTAKPQAESRAEREKKLVESPLAGTWYTADKNALSGEIKRYLEKAEVESLPDVIALILPHAGYRYSGQVAAYGVKQVAGRKFSRVIVMGPSHRVPLENTASVSDATHYSTPLGEIPLDVEFIVALKEHAEFRSISATDQNEHSVQIEIPLLQQALGEFHLVPIVVGQIDSGTARAMAGILAGLIDPHTLVVASSDFTHYGPNFGYRPFRDRVQENIKTLDMGAFEFIRKKDLDGFAGYIDQKEATICGHCPISVLLAMLPEESTAHLLKYDTSGALTGDRENSVSYLCASFTGKWPEFKLDAAEHPEAVPSPLSEEDKQRLLKLARETLAYTLEHKRMPKPEDLGIEITPGMNQVMGAFVTLKKHGELRGCIGEIIPQRPIYRAVMAEAVNAGVKDPRFDPVQSSELPDLEFEVSAYAEGPKPVGSYEDIELGRHGIVLEKGGRSALFLPQVAPEQGWDLPQTLEHLARKAGLAPDAWKEGARFSVFEAVVFGERHA